MGKEGKVNTKFVVSVLFFLVVMAFLVFPLGIELTDPVLNDSINTTLSRNINFTFVPTWEVSGENQSNCSLWTNFTGTWESMIEFNGTLTGIHNASSNITNGSTSFINYTFAHDIGLMVWDIACKNFTIEGTAGDVWVFNESNRSLSIDTNRPEIFEHYDTPNLWNTTDETPILYFNLTDINGTGINLTINGDNATLNVTIFNDNYYTAPLESYNISNTSLDCESIGNDSITSTLCSLDFATFPLTNGTKYVNISVSDRAGWNSNITVNFTVDQIKPYYGNLTIVDIPGTSGIPINDTSGVGGTGVQGTTFWVVSNWTDNLTQPYEIRLLILNTSKSPDPLWEVVNYTNITLWADGEWGNMSYTPDTGHNMFEGRNISVRVNATDRVGNFNLSPILLLQVNDTTAPSGLNVTLYVGTVVKINGTNISDTTPTIVWNITEESSQLDYVAIQVISPSEDYTSIHSGCNLFQNYTFTGTPTSGTMANGSMTVKGPDDQLGCNALGNGTYGIRFTVGDTWGNSELYLFNFTIETGESMNLTLGLIEGGDITAAVNQSNVTPGTALYFNYTDGNAALDKIIWVSSCNNSDSSINSYTNESALLPFNYSGCKGVEANWTINLTANTTAGNSISQVYQFAVDDYFAPTGLIVHSPTEGLRATGLFELNVSALDHMSRISAVGYYLDGSEFMTNHSMNGTDGLLGIYQGQNVTGIGISANFTAGTHTIKFRVNDSLGNAWNSTDITFTQVGPILFSEKNDSIELYMNTVFGTFNMANASIKIKTDAGTYEDITTTNGTNNTYEILYQIVGAINVSITELNGSAANWDKINFTPYINNTPVERGVEGNWTNIVLNSTWFNNSIAEFISNNNSYYGVVVMPFNISGTIATAEEFWWIVDEDTLTTRRNISECTGAFSATTLDPCWNYTKGGRTEIYVPHFSMVLAVNDSSAPNITVNSPTGAQGVSGFMPNITLSSDAVSCGYKLNITSLDVNTSATSNISISAEADLVGSNNICTWGEIRYKNGVYNISYNATDASGNTNVENGTTFVVLDETPPNTPNSSRVSISASSTSATITITGINESVNANVSYGSNINALEGSPALETDYSRTQEVSLTGLSAETRYYFNVTVCDYNDNCMKNGTFNFTTSTAEAAAAAAAAAAAGGGGGGAVPVSKVADSKGQMWSIVPAGSSFSLDVDKATIAVTSVAVSDTKSELKNVDLEVQALTENPVTTEAAAKVYQYLRINKKNILDTDAGSFKIGFRVTKAWLTENGLVSGDIVLYRFKDGWNELATSVTGTDSLYVNYEAETPGFSSFAIGTKTGVVVEEVPEEVPAEEVPEEVAPPEPVTEPEAVVAPAKAPVAWIIAAIVIILGIVLIMAYQKKKQQI